MRLRAAFAALAITLCASPALADAPETFVLSFARGPGAEVCPNERVLEERVTAQLGRNPFRAGSSRRVEVRFERQGGRFVFTLSMHEADDDVSAERTLDDADASCDALADAASLTVAIAIDPDATARPRPAPPAPSALPRDPPVMRRRITGSTTLRAVGSLGLLPRAAAGVSLASELRVSSVIPLRPYAAFTAYPQVASPLAAFRGHSFGAWMASLGACALPLDTPRWDLGLCLSLDAGALSSAVSQAYALEAGELPLVSTTLSTRVAVRPVRPLRLEAGIAARVPFTRYKFETVPSRTLIFDQGILSAEAFFGVGLDFR